MPRKTVLFPMFLLLLLSSVTVLTQVFAQAEVCLPLVEQALEQVGNNCSDQSKNTACYGFNRVAATFNQVEASQFFRSPSDMSDIGLFETIQTAPLYLPTNQWGIAVLKLQASLPQALPGKATVFMLLGDSQVENAVPPEQALATNVNVTVESQAQTTLLSAPDVRSNPISEFPASTVFQVDGISPDGQWLRAVQDDVWGWVSRDALAENSALDTLPLIDTTTRSPMQAFIVNTGIGSLDCEDAPNMLVIQGPKETVIDLNANGADISLGSTIILQTLGTPPLVLASITAEVTAVAFSSDRSEVATGYADGSVRTWDAITGAIKVTTPVSTQRITDLAYRPGTRLLAAASLGAPVTLIDGGETRLLQSSGDALGLAFSGDGTTLAVGGTDGSIGLWDVESGNADGVLSGHSGAVNALAALGDQLASGGADGSVRLWNLATGAAEAPLTGHSGAVTALSFQSDGARLASGSADGTIRLWHLDGSGAPDVLQSGAISDLDFTAEGDRLLSVGTDEDVQVWSIDALGQRSPIKGLASSATKIALSLDGFYLVGGSTDGTARLWRITPSEMQLAVIDGQAVVDGSIIVPAGYYTRIKLDESGRAVIDRWSQPLPIGLPQLRPLSVVERLPESVVNYPAEIPEQLVSLAATATYISGGGGGGGTLIVGLPTSTGFPTNTLAPTATLPGGTVVPTTVPTSAPTATLPPTPVTFGDTMWNDVNGNGVQDAGEGALEGMTVGLGVNPIVQSTTTDANGNFSFTANPGEYYLEFSAPPGFVFGAESGIDPTTGQTPLFTLQNGVTPPRFPPALTQADPNTDFSLDTTITVNGVEPSLVESGLIEGLEFDAEMKISNVGAQWGTNVQVTVTMPDGFEVLSASPTLGSYNAATGLWTVGTLPNGEDGVLNFHLRVKSGTVGNEYVLIQELTFSNQNDTDGGNDSSALDIHILAGADLTVTKTVDNPTPDEGDTITYTITVTNGGPQAAPGLSVIEPLPAGITFTGFNASQGNFFPDFDEWDVNDLAVGETATLILTATVDAGTDGMTISNSAEAFLISSALDFNKSDNASGAAIEVGGSSAPLLADLSVNKTASDDVVLEGDSLDFTITVTNNGPEDAAGVVIVDQLPGSVTHVSDTGGGSYDPASGNWTVGSLANGDTATLTITVTVNSGTGGTTFDNFANVGVLDQTDTLPGNNESSATVSVEIPPETADLVVSKAASVSEAVVGDQFTFTVAVTNDGPDDASGVFISDVLPASVTYVSHVASAGSYSPGSGAWEVGALPVGATATLTITVQVNAGAAGTTVTNTATVLSLDQIDENNTNDTRSAFVEVAAVDIDVDKTVDVFEPAETQTINFTVTVTNLGPEDATGIVIADAIPAGLTFVSSLASQGSYSGGVWTVGSLANGAQATLTLTVTVNAGTGGTFITNQASVQAVDQRDNNSFNDTAFSSIQVANESADLSIFKSASNDFPEVGETVSFSISLSNFGPADVSDVHILDILPDGLVYQSQTADQGSYNPVTGVWTVGNVIDGDFVQLRIFARVSPGTQGITITNTAAMTSASLPDPRADNNSDSVSFTVQNPGTTADLSLEKTTFNLNPDEGDTFSFEIAITNNGPNVATHIELRDLLPAGLTYLSGGFGYDPATGLWTINSLANGETISQFLQVTVDGGTSGTSITNSAQILGLDQTDPNSANNSDSVILSVQDTQLLADLHVTKTLESNPTAEVGEEVRFLVSVSNEGPDNALGVQVRDLLPATLLYLTAFVDQGSYDPVTGIWNVGTISSDDSAHMTLEVAPAAGTQGTTLTNTASVLASEQTDPDPSDNSASASVTVAATVPVSADLHLSKGGPSVANTGEIVNFFISVFNNGPDNATGVQVLDLLPAGLEYVSHSSGDNYNPTTGVWNIGAIESSSSAFLQINARVTAALGSTLTNTASVANLDQTDPDPSNDSESVTVNVGADLALTKSASAATVNEGDIIEYSLTITNNGPGGAQNVRLTDVLPPSLTYISSSPGTYDPATGTISFGFLSVGSQPVTVRAFANVGSAGTTITNTASVSAASPGDPNPGNNSASASVGVENEALNADLSITKTADNGGPNPGTNVTFIITVTNNGPDAATNVQVTDVLPFGLSHVFDFADVGSYDPATGVWTIGALANGASVDLTLGARVDDGITRGDTITNSASVSAEQADSVPANNTASVTLIVATTDLQVEKTVFPASPNEGAEVTYTITVTNLGPGRATNVVVTDMLPPEVTFSSASSAYNPATGVWTVGSIDHQFATSRTLELRATVNSGTSGTEITNTATLTSVDQIDSNAANDAASAVFTAGAAANQNADLSLNKTTDNDSPDEGETFRYTITVSNGGPGAATGVVVRDLLPAGLIFDAASTTRGSYDSATGIWTVGGVPFPGSATLTIRAIPDSGTSTTVITNTAEIMAADQFDPDSTPGNGAGAEDDQRSVEITVGAAATTTDLSISKGTSTFNVSPGEEAEFTIFLSNQSANGATGIQVTDMLPSDLTFVSASATQGSYEPATGIWSLDALPGFNSASLTIRATVDSDAAAEVINQASITDIDQTDTDLSDNADDATVNVERVDLSVGVSAFPTTTTVGSQVAFTISVTNNGPSFLNDAAIFFPIPADSTLVSSSTSSGAYNPSTGMWTIGFLSAGESEFLDVIVTADAEPSITANASLTATDPVDSNAGNNSASLTVPVAEALPFAALMQLGQADVELSKQADNSAPAAGDQVLFTLRLTNHGPDAASFIAVEDRLPAGLSYVSHSGDGSYDPQTGIWTVETLESEASAGLRMVVSTDANLVDAEITNRAQVVGLDQIDPLLDNNVGSATITVSGVEATPEATMEVTVEPTAEVTPEATEAPTAEVTPEVTVEPTAEGTQEPTAEATEAPTAEVTPDVTVEPTAEGTQEPTVAPTEAVTPEVTQVVVPEQTVEPTAAPTDEPTAAPTDVPTQAPTATATSDSPPLALTEDVPLDPPENGTSGDTARLPGVFALAGIALAVTFPFVGRRRR